MTGNIKAWTARFGKTTMVGMQIPMRRSQINKPADENAGDTRATAEAVARWKRELERMEKQERPVAAEDVHRLAQLGDFSENAEYQEAKARLRRLNDRITRLKDRVMRAVIIEGSKDGSVAVGSTVMVLSEQRSRSLTLVGPHEADPLRGKISIVSPLGKALIGHVVGDVVTVKTPDGERVYEIVEVK